MGGYTDIHSHFVYGVDDGARTRNEMERMLDAAYENGITTLIATPHMTPAIQPFDDVRFQRHLDAARAYCQRKGYDMTLYAGAELMYTPAMAGMIVSRRLPTMAGTNCVLMEFVPDISFSELESVLDALERSGYVAVIAHVERYDCLLRGTNARRLKARHDIFYQINASTVVEAKGFFRRRRIRSLFEERLIDYVASDAHDCKRRTFLMDEAYRALERIVEPEYAVQLTKAIVGQSF